MNPTQIPCVTSERKNNNYKIHLVSPRKGKPFYKAKEVTIIDCFTYGLIRNSHRIDPFKHYSWLTDFVSEIQNEEGLVFVSPDWEWMKDEYKQNILNEPWIKLDKTTKLQKFKQYVANNHSDDTETEQDMLYNYLAINLDRKKLLKAKEVIYEKDTGVITSIPSLLYNTTTKKYTLKRCDKRQSTLKSLAPKKNKENKGNKIDINN